MTVADLHKAFKVNMDKNAESVAFGGCPAFLPEEIDLFLNQAFIEVICNKFTGSNTLQIPFEGSVKRVADLEKLIKTDVNLSLTLTPNTNILVLSDFNDNDTRMFYVTSQLHFSNGNKDCILVDHDRAKRFIKTYDNDPWISTPVCVQEDNELKIMVDLHTVKTPYTLDLTYVSFPPKIVNTAPTTDIDIVPDRVLYEVINRAVLIALENIEAQRSQTKSQLNNIQE